MTELKIIEDQKPVPGMYYPGYSLLGCECAEEPGKALFRLFESDKGGFKAVCANCGLEFEL